MQIYKNWLRSNGVKFEELPFGLGFQYQGSAFILWNNTEDRQYLALSMPTIYAIEGNEYKVLKVINKMNCDIKAVKAVIRDNAVWLNIEMFIDNTPDIEDFMGRILGILLQCRMRFRFELDNY